MDHVETEPALDAERVRRWREERLARDYERVPPRREHPTTLSGIPIDDVYTPVDVEGIDPERVREAFQAAKVPISLETPIGDEQESTLADIIADAGFGEPLASGVASCGISGRADLRRAVSDCLGNFGERRGDPQCGAGVDSEVLVAAAQILPEGVPGLRL